MEKVGNVETSKSPIHEKLLLCLEKMEFDFVAGQPLMPSFVCNPIDGPLIQEGLNTSSRPPNSRGVTGQSSTRSENDTVIERLLENWLNRANERSFQYPFCYWLASQGYRVLHLSRHCGMEIGKDVLAIDPQGVPCAYQIKGVAGGKLSQARWRSEVQGQVQPLLNTVIVHPSISSNVPHRSFLVINGELEEEVFYEIENLNRCQERDGYPNRKLEVILKGDLLDGFKKLQTDFWVENLVETKTYLELILEDGRGQLPKEKLSRLIQAALPFEGGDKDRPGKAEAGKTLAGLAIICTSAISSFTNEKNHVAALVHGSPRRDGAG